MKILVAAYVCDPHYGSEQAVGWGWVAALAHDHDVWVITADWQRESIERFVARAPAKYANIRLIYVRPKPWHYNESNWFWRKCEGSILKPLMHSAYRIWQRDALALARELHSNIQFDLAHQLTFVGFRFPGYLWKLDIPFVWGPIGGLENTPWRLLPSMGLGGCVYYAARNVVNYGHKLVLRSPHKAFAKAGSGVIAATSRIQAEILRWYGVPSEVICEVGTPIGSAAGYSLRAAGEPLRIAWSGRHLPGKALQFLLQALHTLPEGVNWQLDVFGDGPLRSRWQKLASRLGIASRCVWHGQISRDEVLRSLHRAHLFVVTSLKDLTSTVILEAMAQGLPVLCPNHCGFPDVVDETCGVRLPIGTAVEFERSLAEAIIKLAGDESRRRRLAGGALVRAPRFSWDAKARAIDTVYRRVMASFDAQSSSHIASSYASSRN